MTSECHDGHLGLLSMTSRRSTKATRATLISIALVAAACSGDDSSAERVDVSESTTTAQTETGGTSSDGASDTTDAAADGATASDDSEAGTDGDVSGEPDQAALDEARSNLAGGVRGATEVWPTDWTRSTIDTSELALGIAASDPRDRITPIYLPDFESLDDASDWLNPQDPGVLVEIDGDARFYALGIMTRHEIVNDTFGEVPVAVTYCPLCNTAVTFDRRVEGETIALGVSGLLRHSDMVMWDNESTSLWQQVTGEGIVGRFAGTELEVVTSAIVSFGDFVERFPDGSSLVGPGSARNGYGINPYAGYSSSPGPIGGFFSGEPDPRRDALERVVGVAAGGVNAAYPFAELEEVAVVNDDVGGVPVVVFWGGNTVDALDQGSITDSRVVGTGIAFDRTVDGQELTFSSDGDDLFVDAETGTTWTLLGVAVDGPLAGSTLELVDHRNEFWFAWARFFPEGDLRLS